MPKLLYLSISVFVFIFCSCSSIKRSPEQYFEKKITTEATKVILSTLSSDDMGGRLPGNPGYEAAAKYVVNQLEESKIKPFFENGFFDTVLVKQNISYNVVGKIKSKKKSDEYILIGAHLDHIGFAKSGTDTIFNGANDDASGVTAVVQIAKSLSKLKLSKNIIIALFTEEESGLNGSKSLAKRLKNENINIQYVINFEMLGTALSSGEGQVYATGFEISDFPQMFNANSSQEFVQFLPQAKQYKLFFRSDNHPFYEAFDVPSHTLSTFDFTNYDYYHKVDDEVEFLDIKNMNLVIQKSALGIYNMLKNNDIPILSKIE